jgi:hypothetical protein
MSSPYTVKSGDNLSLIAQQHGVKSWRDIYDHPDNAAFRLKRPDPNRIFAGDVLMIPGGDSPSSPLPPLPPPLVPKPVQLQRQDAERAIKDYLTREMRRDVVSVLVDHSANLIVLGEKHYTFDAFKAFFLGELIRPVRLRQPLNTHFHASERFSGDPATRKTISDFMHGTPRERERSVLGLPGPLKTFLPVLAMAMDFPNRRFGILGIDALDVRGEDPRHTALFRGFVTSAAMCPDVPAGSINNSTSRGNILLGARHAARRHAAGLTTATTCAQLISAGWTVHAVRLTVPHDPSDALYPEELNLVVIGGSDRTPIDVLKIIDDVAGGKPFYADLTKEGSPFAQLREAAEIPYNQLFDAILHISARTVPFPVR